MNVRSVNTRYERVVDARLIWPLVARALSTYWRGPIGEVRVTRVFPMGEGLYSIEYRTELYDGSNRTLVPVCGCFAVGGQIPGRYLNHPRMIVDEKLALALPLFPSDPKLDAVSGIAAAGNNALPPSIARALPEHGTQARATLIAHRLEKRCVFRFDLNTDDGRTVAQVLKVGRRKRVRAAAAAYQFLTEAGFQTAGTNIPLVLAADEEQGMLLMEAAPGQGLHDLIDAGHPMDAMESAAALMRRLHGLAVDPTLKRYGADEELAHLDEWRRAIAVLYPEIASAIERRLDRLRTRQPNGFGEWAPVHGDFHDKQILFTPGQSTLIDCDGLSAGDPARDYGNLLAHIELRSLQQSTHRAILAAALGRLRKHYPMGGPRLRWWTASALTRLAAVYALRPAWRVLCEPLLSRADEELEQEVAET